MKNLLLFAFVWCPIYLLLAQSFPTYEEEPLWTLVNGGEGGNSWIDSLSLDTPLNLCGEEWTPIRRRGGGINSIIGYLKENSSKVYFRTSFSSRDDKTYLMYDFSLELGDSSWIGIPGNYISSNPDLDTALVWVINTDSIYFGVQKRKTFYLAYNPMQNYSRIWVEGVGDLYHPFYSSTCEPWITPNCDVVYNFQCLKTNEGILYSNGEAASCYYFPNRLYVDQDATSGENNGTSWQNAFPDLQDALAIADYGDTIWVAEGTYRPTSGVNREQYFELKNGVAIYGGFNGAETSLEQRDYLQYETVLSGDIGVQGEQEDNSYHVLYTIGVDTFSILNGFIIKDGYAIVENETSTSLLNRGGGLLVDTNLDYPVTIPRIENCTFIANSAKYGGAVAFIGSETEKAMAKLYNCSFYQNRGEVEGGAIYKRGSNIADLPFFFEACKFENNWAWQGGGAIFFSNACDDYKFKNCFFKKDSSILEGGAIFYETFCEQGELEFTGCIFEENEGLEGGAFYFVFTGSNLGNLNYTFKIDSSEFNYNNGLTNGGAIAIYSSGGTSNIEISNSVFNGNTATARAGGIHLYLLNNTMSTHINTCVFEDNQAYGVLSGGAIAIRGDQFTLESKLSETYISNTLFSGNSGALSIERGSQGEAYGNLLNCTITGTTGFPLAKAWDGVTSDPEALKAKMWLENCIIWEPDKSLNEIFLNGSITYYSFYGFYLDHCILSSPFCYLQGGNEACGEGMLFNTDPLFIAPEDGDFSVAACSPAINAGINPDSLISETDLNGEIRILENIIDMGSYERTSFDVQIAEISNVSCHDGHDAQIYFAIEGDEPYEYFWIRDSTSGEGIDQLEAGDYLFTITDVNDCSDTLSLTITEPEPIIGQYTINHASTPSTSDGSIILNELTGGTAPYEFFWNNGDTTASLINIPPGEYVLSVLDSNGCEQVYEFEVSFLSSINGESIGNQIALHPNPAKDQVILSLTKPLSERSRWLLYNNLGQLVLAYDLAPFQEKYRLSLTNIPTGIYVWEIRSVEGRITKNKLLITQK